MFQRLNMMKKMRKNKYIKSKYSIPIFIDTGPLLLLLVGTFNKDLIGNAKRIKEYSINHYDILIQYLAGRKINVTPGVLAEVSNLANSIKNFQFEEFIEQNLSSLNELGECFISKNIIINSKEFPSMGYTDTSIILSAIEEKGEVLTGDQSLVLRCHKLGLKATHMDYIEDVATQF